MPGARKQECECASVHASVCPAGMGTGRNRSWIRNLSSCKAVLRDYSEQLGALASQLGLSLEETKGNIKVAVRVVGEVRVAKDASEVGGCTELLLKSCAGGKEG